MHRIVIYLKSTDIRIGVKILNYIKTRIGVKILNYIKTVCILLILLSFSVVTTANDTLTAFFPTTEGSFWVYGDREGNEFTRTSTEQKNIAGEIFHTFSYEPAIEGWEKYNYLLHPFMYQVDTEWIRFYVENEIESTIKSKLKKRLDEIAAELRQKYTDQLPPGISLDVDYTIEPTAQDTLYFLPSTLNNREKWITTQVSVRIQISMNIKGTEINIPEANKSLSLTMKISETGERIGKESVKTAVGTFENCLKIEYRTKTTSSKNTESDIQQELTDQSPKDKITTIWLAPNVGIVKLMSSIVDSEEVETVELKSFKIESPETVNLDK